MKRIAIILVFLSFVLYGLLLIVPFMPLAGSTKIWLSTFIVVVGEVSFWVGGIILGKEVVSKYRKHLNPKYWLKNKDKENKENKESN